MKSRTYENGASREREGSRETKNHQEKEKRESEQRMEDTDINVSGKRENDKKRIEPLSGVNITSLYTS